MKNHHQLTAVLLVIFVSITSFAIEFASTPGEFLIKLSSKNRNLTNLEAELGGKIVREIKGRNIFLLQRSMVEQPEYAIQTLKKHPQVLIAEQNYIYKADKTSSEPEYSKLWGLNNIGQTDTKQEGIAGVDISAEKAWDLSTGNDEVIVAVIDTGIDLTHPDLQSNLWINEIEAKGTSGIDDDGNGFVDDVYGMNFSDPAAPNNNPDDDNGHGSHCAGTIGGVGHNGEGVVGVNWKVRMMPVKFLGASGGGTLEGAIRSIDYATQMGANIMSNSWGGGSSSQLLQEAIERAEKAGILFVAASGNDGMNNDTNPHYPSSYSVKNIVSVAAIDNRGELAGFSNVGKNSVHIAAPGVNIFSTYRDSGYEWLSGTSMATPHVSGVAALVLGQNRQMDYSQLKERLMKTTKKLSALRNKVVSNGAVNAYNSLTDTIEAPDTNDPYFWQSKAVNISNSAHPYKPSTTETFEVNMTEGTEFSIYFESFDTEKKFDKVSFYDQAGTLLFEMTGSKDDSFSPVIKGNYVKMVFTSDTSVEKFGFNGTKIHFR